MTIGVFSNNFARTLSELVKKSKVSGHKLSRYAQVDEPYIYHLIKGDKKNPSPEIVIRICFALASLSGEITIEDLDELLKTRGHTLFPRNSKR